MNHQTLTNIAQLNRMTDNYLARYHFGLCEVHETKYRISEQWNFLVYIKAPKELLYTLPLSIVYILTDTDSK